VFKILVDLPDLVGESIRPLLQPLLDAAASQYGKPLSGWPSQDTVEQRFDLFQFLGDRFAFVLESRGFDTRNVRAVTRRTFDRSRPADELRKLKVLPEFTESPDFLKLAVTFKRVKNIAKELPYQDFHVAETLQEPLSLTEPAEFALLEELEVRGPVIDRAVSTGEGYREAFAEAAKFKPAVDRFFADVLVMAPDPKVRKARLRIMRRLEGQIVKLADISEIVAEDTKSG